MLRECCAGICGGAWSLPQGGSAQEGQRPARPAFIQRPVVKPVRPLDEPELPEGSDTFEGLIGQFGLLPAPPNVATPMAVVTKDFPRNSSRLLILLPSAGAPPGKWDTGLSQLRGAALPLLRWAQANGYAFCLFAAEALQSAPDKVWDSVLKGSPARSAVTLVAGGQLPVVQAGLAPMHAVLFSRFRSVLVHHQDVSALRAPPESLPKELRQHLGAALVREPAEWATLETFAAHQQLFEMLQQREDRWGEFEGRKYVGLGGLKENDVPGLRRLGMDERLERLSRDREKDELARLVKSQDVYRLGKTEGEDSDEPGID